LITKISASLASAPATRMRPRNPALTPESGAVASLAGERHAATATSATRDHVGDGVDFTARLTFT
jgi:hypothetical protein